MPTTEPLVLVLLSGAGAPARRELVPGYEQVIGRGGGGDLVLEDRHVGPEHARLVWEDDGPVLEDLGSEGGTRVDGRQVERSRLVPGSRIQVRHALIEVRRLNSIAAEVVTPAPGSSSGAGATPEGLLAALEVLLDDEAETGTPPDALGRAVEALVVAFRADRGLVAVPTGRGEFRIELERRGRQDGGLDRHVSRRLLTQVAERGEAVLLDEVDLEGARADMASLPTAVRSVVAAPLELPEATAVLYLDSAVDRRRFREGDRELLLSFAHAAGRLRAKAAARGRALRRAAQRAELQRREHAHSTLVGESEAMRRLREEVAKAAASDIAVLVTGESGTGKELVARALHLGSARVGNPFVAVNCAALPRDLVEAELFGHEKGAFTGAGDRRLGRFELADGGTLFLDEIGELPPAAQGTLLRVLQERSLIRVGGNQEVPVDFRLVAATNLDLEAEVAAGRFREDLYYRVAVFRIRLPPLRERGEDALLLADRFLAEAAREVGRELAGMAPDARSLLLEQRWPGNVRQLRNVILQAVVREETGRLTSESLKTSLARAPAPGRGPGPGGAPQPAADPLDQFPSDLAAARVQLERLLLRRELATQKGNVRAVADALGVSRQTLYAKLKEHGLDPDGFR
jgi:DNA-binding NtrC family response regulator